MGRFVQMKRSDRKWIAKLLRTPDGHAPAYARAGSGGMSLYGSGGGRQDLLNDSRLSQKQLSGE